MNEWITFGEMVDKLKIGQEANPSNEFSQKVYKTSDGYICWKEDDMIVTLSPSLLNSKWRIIPKYVKFEEAIEAFREGKSVRFHRQEDSTFTLRAEDYMFFSDLKWEDFVNGKFTIED